tara:strand:- start:51 stop:200 length:150 start_codon:yes stop_codon:yes gene_type:complete
MKLHDFIQQVEESLGGELTAKQQYQISKIFRSNPQDDDLVQKTVELFIT